MANEGGDNVKDTVFRIMTRLMTNKFMTEFNRTGVNGKLSFIDKLEKLVKGNYYYKFYSIISN